MKHSDKQSVIFPDLLTKPATVAFDEPATTSDGGALLLRALDAGLGFVDRLASKVFDGRQASKVIHQQIDLFRQRVYGIACGYADCNDADRVSDDPMQKALLERDPLGDESLASQATLSRFENGVRIVELYKMGMELMEFVIERHLKRLGRRKVKLITIDMDPTEDKTHGAQQLSMFNGHYGAHCYLPQLAFLTFNEEPEQYLFAAVLRSGLASAHDGALGILKRVLPRLRESFPKARIVVRLDGGFATPKLFEFLEKQKRVKYLVAFASNPVVLREIEPIMEYVRAMSELSGETERLFGETQYAAKSWKQERRLIMKA